MRGRLNQLKNYAEVLRRCNCFARAANLVHLYIAGEGAEKRSVAQQQTSGIGDKDRG